MIRKTNQNFQETTAIYPSLVNFCKSLTIGRMDGSTDHPTERQIEKITPRPKRPHRQPKRSCFQTSILYNTKQLRSSIHPDLSLSQSSALQTLFFFSRVVIMRESPLLSFAFVTHASDTFFFNVALDSALGGLCVNQKWTNNCLDLTDRI